VSGTADDRAIPDKGLRHRIHRVSAPTLLVWGERDAREYAGLLQRSETVLVADAGHLPRLEQTERVREVVLGFLDRPAAELPSA
jgi:pimeloyl-ACP methyl ester carboxylesterase